MHLTRRLALGLAPLAVVAVAGCEEGLKPDPGTYPSSSRLGISADGKHLYVALADHDLVRSIDAETGAVEREVHVGDHPHRLTVLSDGRVAVSARYGGAVSILDMARGEEEARIEVGSDPFGLLEVDGDLVVALAGDGQLARIDLDRPSEVAQRIDLDEPEPRGLALAADGTLYVSHFSAGALSAVDLSSGVRETRVAMSLPSNPFFFPNQLDSITVSPAGDEVVVPHEECNNDPAQFGATGFSSPDFVGATVQYYVEGPTGFPAVVPAISRVNAVDRVLASDGPGTPDPFAPAQQEPPGPAPTIINPLDRNLLGATHVNAPVAVALADGGRVELVVNQASGNVLVRRAVVEEGTRSILGVVDAGVGASSIVLSPDGATAYVFNEFDSTVTSFEVPILPRKSRSGGLSVASAGAKERRWDPYGVGEPLPAIEAKARYTVAEQVLPDEVVRGRVLFHSVDERMTSMGAIACASCHPGGSDDGITWNFAEGPRQTPALWGGIGDTAPFHWDQAVVDQADLSRVTIQGRMGGQGLAREDMQAIFAFLDTIPAPAPPSRAMDGASIERGRAIFESAETGCTGCHAGPDFTDGQAHDVATGVGFVERESQVEFATPVLKGLAHTAPYLHDGSARTLRDVVEKLVVTDRMGRGSHLTSQQIDDLVAFLETL